MRPNLTPEEIRNVLIDGSVVDPETDCWEWQHPRDHDGYGITNICKPHRRVHRIAAHLYLGFDLTSKLDVCHHCDNPSCCNPDHLFIGTRTDNMRDASRKGRTKTPAPWMKARGEAVSSAKLTEADVREIRERYTTGESYSALGRAYDVDFTNIRNIVKRRTWKHVK